MLVERNEPWSLCCCKAFFCVVLRVWESECAESNVRLEYLNSMLLVKNVVYHILHKNCEADIEIKIMITFYDLYIF